MITTLHKYDMATKTTSEIVFSSRKEALQAAADLAIPKRDGDVITGYRWWLQTNDGITETRQEFDPYGGRVDLGYELLTLAYVQWQSRNGADISWSSSSSNDHSGGAARRMIAILQRAVLVAEELAEAGVDPKSPA